MTAQTGYADTVYLNGRIWPGPGEPAAPHAPAPEPTALATAAGRLSLIHI